MTKNRHDSLTVREVEPAKVVRDFSKEQQGRIGIGSNTGDVSKQSDCRGGARPSWSLCPASCRTHVGRDHRGNGGFVDWLHRSLPGRMPERTGWKPALPRGSHFCIAATPLFSTLCNVLVRSRRDLDTLFARKTCIPRLFSERSLSLFPTFLRLKSLTTFAGSTARDLSRC
jgi:hypothetical protein